MLHQPEILPAQRGPAASGVFEFSDHCTAHVVIFTNRALAPLRSCTHDPGTTYIKACVFPASSELASEVEDSGENNVNLKLRSHRKIMEKPECERFAPLAGKQLSFWMTKNRGATRSIGFTFFGGSPIARKPMNPRIAWNRAR